MCTRTVLGKPGCVVSQAKCWKLHSVDSLVTKNDSIQSGLCVEGTRLSRREGMTQGPFL